jgi:hypothetical protein
VSEQGQHDNTGGLFASTTMVRRPPATPRAALPPLLLALALLLLSSAADAVRPRGASPNSQTYVVVGGSASHLLPSAETLSAESDKGALPTLAVSVEAAAGLPAVLTRLVPPYPLSVEEDGERVAQLAAASPSRDAAATGAAAASPPPPRAAVLLHLLGVPPEHAEALAERVGITLTELGSGVVRYLRVRDDDDKRGGSGTASASALVRAGAHLAAANSAPASPSSSSSSSSSAPPPPASFRVLESAGSVERCGMECLAHRLTARAAAFAADADPSAGAAAFAEEAADALRHAFGLAVPGLSEDDQPVEKEEREAVRRASVPAELLAGELASVLEAADAEHAAAAADEAAAAAGPPTPTPTTVHVYEATFAGLQALRRADDLAVAAEMAEGGSGGLPGASDDAEARVQAAADAFLATLDAVYRAVARRHGGPDSVVVQVSLLGDAPVHASAAAAAAIEGAAMAGGGESAGGGGSGSSSSSTPAVLGGAEAAAMRAPYLAWKRQARRALLQAAGEIAGQEEEEEQQQAEEQQQQQQQQEGKPERPFSVSATYWGVAILLVWCSLGAVYCLANMPLAEDTLLFGARKKSD